MAAVQPRVAPRRHQPPPPVPPPPAAPSQAPGAARPQLPRKRGRADAAAVSHSRKERVAESSCCPSPSVLDQLVLIEDDSGEEDDGCGSCVDGDGAAASCGQDDGEEESPSGVGVAWWSQESGGGRRCSFWANGSRGTAERQLRGDDGQRDDEDAKVAAARRQEEDRKFWEACLTSGYP